MKGIESSLGKDRKETVQPGSLHFRRKMTTAPSELPLRHAVRCQLWPCGGRASSQRLDVRGCLAVRASCVFGFCQDFSQSALSLQRLSDTGCSRVLSIPKTSPLIPLPLLLLIQEWNLGPNLVSVNRILMTIWSRNRCLMIHTCIDDTL